MCMKFKQSLCKYLTLYSQAMAKSTNLVKYIIGLATFAVFIFALLQLTQHGYDAQSYTEHLVIDIQNTGLKYY